MGRKNRRRKKEPSLTSWTHRPESSQEVRSRCAFCGRLLDDGDFYWFPDEFGQFVKKCNNERACMSQRKTTAEVSFRKAVRRNAHTKSYWMEGEDHRHGNE